MRPTKISKMNSILLVKIGVGHGTIKVEEGKNLQGNVSPDGIVNGKKSVSTSHSNKLSNLINKSNLLKCITVNEA